MLSSALTNLSFNIIDFFNLLSVCLLLAASVFCYLAINKSRALAFLMGTCLCRALLPVSSLVIFSDTINALYLQYLPEQTILIFVLSFYAWPLFYYAFLNQVAERQWPWKIWVGSAATVFVAVLTIAAVNTGQTNEIVTTRENMIYIAPKWAASLLWLAYSVAYLHIIRNGLMSAPQTWIKSKGVRILSYLFSYICFYGFIIATCNVYFKLTGATSGSGYELFIYGFTFSNIAIDFGCLMLSAWLYLRSIKSINVDDYSKQIDRYLTDENISKISEQIIGQKMYLKTQLSLERCADKVELPPRALTVIINHHYHKTFTDWITDLRIKEAKRLLEDPRYSGVSVSEIASMAGFSSRSAFYSRFSKTEGITPNQDRQKHRAPNFKVH